MNLEQKVGERDARSRLFYRGLLFTIFALTAFLLYELHAILLPILVGAMMAYLFRPIKNWFHVTWIPHELRVIMAVALSVCVVAVGVMKMREMIPNEKQKLELKVRLKYKLNERFDSVFAEPGAVAGAIKKEMQPLMLQLNELLTLSDEDRDLFMKYRRGYKGEDTISDRYFEYFKKNSKNNEREAASATQDEKLESGEAGGHAGWLETLEFWILTPLMFIFLIFDNGQIRTFGIGLVPNRYFEMALTMIDELDDAIGNYLRGTFLECSLVGATMGIGLILLGFPVSVALLVGVISGMANAIPFLGPAIGLVISIAYALIAEDTMPLIPGLSPDSLPIYVAILVGITHLLDNIVYSPVVLGGAVNLHPMVVIIAITAGSILLGFWGMLLAIPTVVILKTGLETLVKELKAYRII
jgi:predicted PurR-regulated permease PerM